MHPSRPLRRLIAVLACTSVLLLPQATTSAAPARPRLLVGEPGSGPQMALPQAPAATNGIAWSDVPKRHWARTAIDYVGATYEWMRDTKQNPDGTYDFQPDQLESRELFARALVRAFAPDEPVDDTIHFSDLPDDDRFYPMANVAVKLGWMTTDADGNFAPAADPVTTRMVHRALVLALGLGDAAQGVEDLHMRNGTKFDTPPDFGTLLIGMRIGLRYNHSTESMDVGPDTPLPRAEVAWSLYRAATQPDWVAGSLAPYATIELPNLSSAIQRVVNFGISYVGYPYVWSGEWFEPSPVGYCCGYQPVGGFDCTGIIWWAMRAASSTYDPPPRDYQGWSLPQRSSAEMAASGGKVRFNDLRPGDLMFYDGDGDGVVDHANTYLGKGWALDSGSSVAGVSILQVGSGWYHDHFVHGRRIIK